MHFRIFILVAVAILAGCIEQNRVITEGNYGPLNIGDKKIQVLHIVDEMVGIESIEPLPLKEINLENPSLNDMSVFDTSDGILVWLDHQPFPLRIELSKDRLVRTWGASNECRTSAENMNVACREIQKLNRALEESVTRTDIYREIYEFDANLPKKIGTFVVGYQKFRIGGNTSSVEYKELLLRNDAWRFTGLSNLSKYEDPFYSRVTLYFKDEQFVMVKFFWKDLKPLFSTPSPCATVLHIR